MPRDVTRIGALFATRRYAAVLCFAAPLQRRLFTRHYSCHVYRHAEDAGFTALPCLPIRLFTACFSTYDVTRLLQVFRCSVVCRAR